VNDPIRLRASPWADPHIVIDKTGMMHLSFTGAYRGASYRDIFYTRNDGTGWDTCQLVTRDGVYHEWYSDIAADRPDNVWVVWDRQDEGPDEFRVYAAHYNGKEWSAEQRLDNDTAYYEFVPQVCLDHQGLPWVVWNGISYSSGHGDVFYNRFQAVGIYEPRKGTTYPNIALKLATCHFSTPVEIGFQLSDPARVDLSVFDLSGRCVAILAQGERQAGTHTVLWDGNVPAGIYICRLRAGRFEVRQKIVLTGHSPGRFR